MIGRMCFFLLVLISATSAFADDERAATSIAAIVYLDGGGDKLPKVCYYDYELVKHSDNDWNAGLLGCDPALIGKADALTPTSPPEGFGVLFHHVEASRRTGYTCPDFVQVTDTVGIHCVIGTKERQKALRHPTPENTRVTHGCINVPTDGLFRKYSARINLVHIR